MKTKNLLLITALLLVLTSFSSCFEIEDPTVLPPKTQTGKNTFGCYVNDKILVAEPLGFGLRSSPYAEYNSTTNILHIEGIGKTNGSRECNFDILNPEENVKKELLIANYSDYDNALFYKGTNVGEIFLTRFDTINKIVSGTFAYKIPFSDNGPWNVTPITAYDSIVRITQGRFDIRLGIRY